MHITGMGVVTCAGEGVNSLWRAALQPESLLRDGLGSVPLQSDNRAMTFCLSAIREAMDDAGWTSMTPEDGFILATTTGQYLMWEKAFIELSRGNLAREEFRTRFMHQPLSDLAIRVRHELGMSGPFSVVATACTASTQALAMASMWLKSGRCRRVLVGGVEVLCTLTVEGFRSLQLLAIAPARPFDRARSGINLSEGAAFMCVEPNSSKFLARLSGFGFSTDGFHMTSPRPDGSGSARAMASALHAARVTPADIDWLHAHGTGSVHNDLSEGAAIRAIFAKTPVPVSSTKPVHGHVLGASGILECALVVKAMAENRVLGTRGLEELDPEVGIHVLAADVEKPLRHVLKNTLGFGGANAALVLSC